MKILIVQRVKASFRKEFFEMLGGRCELILAAGSATPEDGIREFQTLDNAKLIAAKFSYFVGGHIWMQHSYVELINREDPDVVVISPTPRLLSNFKLINYCKSKSIPVIGWGMGEMPGRSGIARKIHALLQRAIIAKLSGVISYSQVAQKYYQGLNNKIVVEIAQNTIDIVSTDNTATVVKEENARGNFHTDIGELLFRSTSQRVLFVGRIIPSKCIDRLIDAVSRVPNVMLTVVGDGPDKYVAYLKRMCKEKGVDAIFAGYRSGNELSEVMVNSDLFVLPGRGGLAINHAMAHGLAVLCCEGDGTEKGLVRQGVTGFYFNEYDPSSLDMSISNLLGGETDLSEVGSNARCLVVSKFTLEQMVENFLNGIFVIKQSAGVER